MTTCRACDGELRLVLDLGATPLANALANTKADALTSKRYPLRLCVCGVCRFVQLDVAIPAETLFAEYLYETPRAASLQTHYQNLIHETNRFWIQHSRSVTRPVVFEMGSNNGEFLAAVQSESKELLGIEPAKSLAAQANERGLPTISCFFNVESVNDIAAAHGFADIFYARHCMAHLDDLRGTLTAIREILAPNGVAVIENAYLMDTLHGTQWDQIYHEHHSYFAVGSFQRLAASVGLHLRHVMHAKVHGGSIVFYLTRENGDVTSAVTHALEEESLLDVELGAFAFRARTCIAGVREGLRTFAYRTVDSYGATAKGNTLLNVVGPDATKVRYAVDSTPSKQGKFLPGTGIPVISEEQAREDRPHVYLLTAWNYEAEIRAKNPDVRFIVPLPFPRLV